MRNLYHRPWGSRSQPFCVVGPARAAPLPLPLVRFSTVQLLTAIERSILDFEHGWWEDSGVKDQAIWETFNVSPARYSQFLNFIIEKDTALEYAPLLVRRLRRLRDARADD